MTRVQESVATKDIILKVETHYVSPDGIPGFFDAHNVNAGHVVKVELDAASGKVGIGILSGSGLDIGTKARLTTAFRCENFIGNIIRAANMRFFEATPDAIFQQELVKTVKGLSGVKDAKTGRPVTDLYLGAPQTHIRLDQHVIFADGYSTVLNPVGKGGIANVRYLPWTNELIAIAVDDQDACVGIVTISMDMVQHDQLIVREPKAWRRIAACPDSQQIVSFGRPKMGKDGRIKIAANLEGGIVRILMITKAPDRRNIIIWSDEVVTDRIAIGVVNGFDEMYASYIPDENGIRMFFEPLVDAHPVEKDYLQ